MAEQGKISILMGIYNCAKTLPAAIDSILAQTYDNWQLIMCDDGSDDDTYTVAKRYQECYPHKIVLLRNDQNRRLAFTLNSCLKVANGEFVARMDADDISFPERFEKQVAFLREHKDIVLVGTAMRWFTDDGEEGAVIRRPDYPDRWTMHKTTAFSHPTVMAYKWVYEALGGYTVLPRTARGQDVDLWFRFFHKGYQGANIPEVLYKMREDRDAFKRRCAHTRWINCQTMLYGYRLLSYPWYWYWKPIAGLLKILVPARAIRWYRRRQKKRQDKQAK